MPVLSILCSLASWVEGSSSVSVSASVPVASFRSCVDRCARFPRASTRVCVSCLRFSLLVSHLWPVVFRALVVNRVMLVCSVALFLRQCASGLAPVRARLFRFPRCHCFVTLSQCLAVCLSCRVLHCCLFVLSAVVAVPVSSLAGVGLVSCRDRGVAFLSASRFRFDCGLRRGNCWSVRGVVSTALVSLSLDVVMWSCLLCHGRVRP